MPCNGKHTKRASVFNVNFFTVMALCTSVLWGYVKGSDHGIF
jgi:hypothetical protein